MSGLISQAEAGAVEGQSSQRGAKTTPLPFSCLLLARLPPWFTRSWLCPSLTRVMAARPAPACRGR